MQSRVLNRSPNAVGYCNSHPQFDARGLREAFGQSRSGPYPEGKFIVQLRVRSSGGVVCFVLNFGVLGFGV